ncbi:MAG: type II toxin-antitoxin system HicB family antitoxin [Gelidibacter sp.]|uniref:type II toxin-antitoxin system HicB family antitoxin n=1 Tax=Gelidibacter sp. TaxID=2018083 RepID=UPI003267274B
MKSINVYVEKAEDGTYWGTSTNAPGVVSAFGASLAELKRNFQQAYLDYIEVAKEIGEDWSQEFENPDFMYEMDLQGFFKLVPEISMAGIATKANINKSLLRQYATGKANASEKRLKEIEEAVHELGQELLSVSF